MSRRASPTERTVERLVSPLPEDDRLERRIGREHAGDDDEVGRDKGGEAEGERDGLARI